MSRLAPKKIRIGIFAETRLITDSLFQILQGESDLACSKISGLSAILANHPEVILLDCQDATGMNLKEISTKLPHARVVVTNGDADGLDIIMCSRTGVTGFTLRAATASEIAKTIRSVAAGGLAVIPQCIGAKLYSQITEAHRRFPDGGLTPREQEVARLAAEGLRNKEIAAQLSLAVETVKTHMRSILRKLSCRNRVQLARLLEGRRKFKAA